MTCICGTNMFSYEGFWRCPHSLPEAHKDGSPSFGPHTAPFADHRLCTTAKGELERNGWQNGAKAYAGKSNLAGPVGAPGSRAKRQPWKAPAVRKGPLSLWIKRHNLDVRKGRQSFTGRSRNFFTSPLTFAARFGVGAGRLQEMFVAAASKPQRRHYHPSWD